MGMLSLNLQLWVPPLFLFLITWDHSNFPFLNLISSISLRAGGGIGEELSPIPFDNRKYAGRFFFDILFFIISSVILFNILFGIIIDTFAQIRDQQNEIKKDFSTRCFICGLKAENFFKNGQGFSYHIKKVSNTIPPSSDLSSSSPSSSIHTYNTNFSKL